MVMIKICDTYSYILLLWLIVRAAADKAAYYIREQDMFVNHGLRNFTTASDLQCCVACMVDDTCESVSYNDANKICQANDRNPDIDETATKTSSNDWTSFYKKNPCRSGWTSYCGSFYHVENTSKNWTSTESNCQALGGHLVDIQNAEENVFLLEFASTNYGNIYYLIGLNDQAEEHTFVWSSSAPNHFQQTIIGNDDQDDYGTIHPNSPEYWIIKPDTYRLASICKADN